MDCLLSRIITSLGIVMMLSGCRASQDSVQTSGESVDAEAWLSVFSSESIESLALSPVEFPDDFKSHPQAAAESFVLEAVLQAADGEPVSVQVQIDRAALKKTGSSHTSWDYTDVMRASITIGKQAAQRQSHRESVSRLALGLAGSEANEMHVADIQLELAIDHSCNARYSLTGTSQDGIYTSLIWQLTECPDTLSLTQFNQWSAAAVQVSGRMVEGERMQEVTGHGWVTHRYGKPPSSSGAVVIDQARLVLGDYLTLEASRSRRRSGRGPQTVLGALGSSQPEREASSAHKEIEMQWREDGTRVSASGNARYPIQIRFDSEEQGLSLLLTPMVEIPEIVDRLGVRWSSAVKVSGSHEGYGFVTMNPLTQGGAQ